MEEQTCKTSHELLLDDLLFPVTHCELSAPNSSTTCCFLSAVCSSRWSTDSFSGTCSSFCLVLIRSAAAVSRTSQLSSGPKPAAGLYEWTCSTVCHLVDHMVPWRRTRAAFHHFKTSSGRKLSSPAGSDKLVPALMLNWSDCCKRLSWTTHIRQYEASAQWSNCYCPCNLCWVDLSSTAVFLCCYFLLWLEAFYQPHPASVSWIYIISASSVWKPHNHNQSHVKLDIYFFLKMSFHCWRWRHIYCIYLHMTCCFN